MKFLPKKREQGSVLVISIVTCLVIATVLASYLALISVRYNMTVRSMGWNAAIPVLEAGIEEAMTTLQVDADPATNGWTANLVDKTLTKSRTNADGSYFYVTIDKAAHTKPIIYSMGFVPAPLGRGYIHRMVCVKTEKQDKVFPMGISAKGMVTLSAGIFDSYCSANGLYNTTSNGLGTKGSIATNLQGTNAINVVNAKVYGTATTGADSWVTTGPTGLVGDKDWNSTHTSGIKPDWSNDDMYVDFPDNSPPPPPPGGYLSMPTSTAQGTFLGSGTYSCANLTVLSVAARLIVTNNAILYCSNNLTMGSFGYIRIDPGASLTLYVGGNTTISGSGVINSNKLPANFSYIGLPTNTSLGYSGTAALYGTINAPQAAMVVQGSAQIFGAAIVNTYTGGNSGSGFHFDESLLAPPESGMLTLTSWEEL